MCRRVAFSWVISVAFCKHLLRFPFKKKKKGHPVRLHSCKHAVYVIIITIIVLIYRRAHPIDHPGDNVWATCINECLHLHFVSHRSFGRHLLRFHVDQNFVQHASYLLLFTDFLPIFMYRSLGCISFLFLAPFRSLLH